MTAPARLPALWRLVLLQGTVAAASLVVEIVAGRVLAPYVGMSLYTWTAVIAVVLAGFSAGHWIGGRIAEGSPERALRLTGWAMAAAAVATALAVPLLRAVAGPVLGALEDPLWAIVALTVLAFFLPSLFAGIPAPVLARVALLARPERAGRALGAIFAAGAVGAIAGTLLAGFLFVSWIGSLGTLAAVTGVYALAALLFLRDGGRAAAGIATALLAAAPAGWTLLGPDPCDRESDYFCIRVVDVSADPERPVRLMVLDHLAHGVSARDLPQVMFTEHTAMLDRLGRARMGQGPARAFFIGGGSYSVPRAWAARAPAPAMTVAEIDPAVTATAVDAFWVDPGTVEILHEDARRALARRPERYDVILGDAFTDIAVPAHLVTEEFFRLVADRLAPGGAYLMNVIDHADRLEALAAIVATLRAVFPVVEVWAERRAAGPGERRVFVVLAATTPTAEALFRTRAPGPFVFGRLSERWVGELLEGRAVERLTDDHAPIARLMRWAD